MEILVDFGEDREGVEDGDSEESSNAVVGVVVAVELGEFD